MAGKFMGAWDFLLCLQENLHAHKIPCFMGVYLGFLRGSANLFLWAWGFSARSWSLDKLISGSNANSSFWTEGWRHCIFLTVHIT